MINSEEPFVTVVPPASSCAAFIREQADFHDVIHVYGDVDLSNSKEMESVIIKPRSVDRSVVMDLTNCVYMDSTALAVLVRAKKHLGHNFKVQVPQGGNVSRLLEVSGLSSFLN